MLQLFKKLFCIHVYEYEQMTEIGGAYGMPKVR